MKLSYIKKASERAQQKVKVLVNRPDFQEDIIELRKKWNIPLEGIKTEEHNRTWNRNLSLSTQKYYDEEWPKHKAELKHLSTSGTYKEYEKRKDELNDAAPLNAFEKDIKSILKKYLLNPKWRHPIRRYILLNDPDNMNISIGVTIAGHLNDYEPVEYQLCLHIDEDTTLEDIKEIWSDVKAHQERLIYRKQKKFQPIPNLDRDKRAYDLQNAGENPENIEKILQEEFGVAMGYDDINTAIKRYRKRLRINQA